jgi:hypothetical protein
VGVNEVAVLYKRESGATVVDVMTYNEGYKAKKVNALYSEV